MDAIKVINQLTKREHEIAERFFVDRESALSIANDLGIGTAEVENVITSVKNKIKEGGQAPKVKRK